MAPMTVTGAPTMSISYHRAGTLAALMFALLAAHTVQAAVVKVAGERSGHWEASFMLNYVGGEKLDIDDLTDSNIDSNLGWGLGFHYNFDNHWNLGFDMAFNNPDYDVDVIDPETDELVNISHSANRFDGQLNVQYNFLEGNITPYVQAGLGWTYMDSNIVKSLSYYCGGFYYPYCGAYANTFDDTSFSYNIGVGLRWDITESVFVKAAFIQQWIDTDGTPAPQTGRAEIGFMY